MTKRSWLSIPPWIFLGAVVVLAPIFIFWPIQNINKMKERGTASLLEKGKNEMRFFEAGLRTGFRMPGGGSEFQRMLTEETVKESDIVYLIVTDIQGNILYHNDPAKIGGVYGTDLDLKRISQSEEEEYREISSPMGASTFEVFRRFEPFRRPFSEDIRMRMGDYFRRPRRSSDSDRSRVSPEYDRSRMSPGYDRFRVTPEVIFVGLDMTRTQEGRRGFIRFTVVMAFVLLLIGFAGIVSLFLLQAYRSAKSSVKRIKAFSDNVVENMPIGLLAMDTEGKIASFNQTAETVLEVTSLEVLGKDAGEVLPKQLESLPRELGAEEEVIEKEIECHLEDGRVIPMDVSVSRLSGDGDTPMGHIILFSDLREMQELKREVERSRRLASLGRLAAGIAHEIRNPLSSIKGFATYFGERYRDVPEDRKTAEIMVQEVERLNRVIGQLLEFARPLNVKKKSTSMQSIIQHSLKMIERDAQAKHIEVKTDLSPGVPDISMDPDRMNQVFLNLFLNAMESMEEGGVLSVDLHRQEDTGSVKITVSDTGIGIDKEDLVHIFDPYFTNKQSGTGLGLAIVHRIIESHKGEVRVESQRGQGTSVTILLPVDA